MNKKGCQRTDGHWLGLGLEFSLEIAKIEFCHVSSESAFTQRMVSHQAPLSSKETCCYPFQSSSIYSNYILSIHIYHFFLRQMFNLGYNIKKVIFLSCYSASMVETFPKTVLFHVDPLVLKWFKRYGITVCGMPRVFLAHTRGGFLRVTSGGKHGITSEKYWATYNKVDITERQIYHLTIKDSARIMENMTSMKSNQG